MADQTIVQNAPDITAMIGYYISTFAPAAAAPIMLWLYNAGKKVAALSDKFDQLLVAIETQNKLLAEANAERKVQTTAIVNK